jgi:single-strand DNA-binding protein
MRQIEKNGLQSQHLHVNHVNIIGRMASEPKIAVLPGGRKVAQFSLATKESYLDEEGNVCVKQNWHRMTAWGRWVTVVEELCTKGLNVAVEGRLVTRFYRLNGKQQMFSEVEINDLIIL